VLSASSWYDLYNLHGRHGVEWHTPPAIIITPIALQTANSDCTANRLTYAESSGHWKVKKKNGYWLLIDWLIDCLIDWLIDYWLIDWLIDCLFDWLIDYWLIDWLIDWLTDWLIVCLIDW
jgi:hypothetical protein